MSWNMLRGTIGLAPPSAVIGLMLILGAAAPASADLITFTADAPGAKPNGYMSPESGNVAFSDSNGADLSVFDFTPQSFGQGLGVFGDFDDSHLILTFTGLADNLTIWFGNDDPGFSSPGDEAVLRVFNGGVEVGMTAVVMNRNDVMDQFIAISGLLFDMATFKYEVDPSQGLIEVVDNIEFDLAQVPEPAILALLAAGAAGLAVRRRRA